MSTQPVSQPLSDYIRYAYNKYCDERNVSRGQYKSRVQFLRTVARWLTVQRGVDPANIDQYTRSFLRDAYREAESGDDVPGSPRIDDSRSDQHNPSVWFTRDNDERCPYVHSSRLRCTLPVSYYHTQHVLTMPNLGVRGPVTSGDVPTESGVDGPTADDRAVGAIIAASSWASAREDNLSSYHAARRAHNDRDYWYAASREYRASQHRV